MSAVTVLDVIDVSPVWAGHPVAFSLQTVGDAQYALYYEENRDMTIAKRRLGDRVWEYAKPQGKSPAFGERATSTRTARDSHNYCALGFDRAGHLHLSGNMHGNPLLYFRTQRPSDIQSFRRLDRMSGQREEQVTYPRFLRGAADELIFAYRDGYSGNGADLYNVFAETTQTWRRLLEQPLTDGRDAIAGQTTCAYTYGPIKGPDAFFHLVWVWRNTFHCETNHSLCYARSRDLVHWETSSGKPLALPITPTSTEVVDPVPIGGGMINGNTLIGFDALGRVVLTYHKFDERGNTQIYNARREPEFPGGWRIAQASKWNFRWEFQGGGTIIFDVKVGKVQAGEYPNSPICQAWWNRQNGIGGALLYSDTLQPIGDYVPDPLYPPELLRVESPLARMEVRFAEDAANPLDKDSIAAAHAHSAVAYVLRWETLPENRDRPLDEAIPPPSMLRLYTLRRG